MRSFRLSANRRRSGFALLVTIVLVAFLVLILIGLATFTRVETQVASNAEAVGKARQNALFALNIAIGRLQTTAAYDRQVTASGDKVPAARADNPFWTAAWDSTGALGAPVWLVSGVGAAPGTDYSTASANNVRLVSTATVGTPTGAGDKRHVYVLKETVLSDQVPGLPAPPDTAISKFAYWIGDEGVKAHIGLEDHTRATASSVVPFALGEVVADTRQVERLARLAAVRGGPDALTGLGLGDETADPGRWAGVEKIVNRSQPRFSYADTTARSNLIRDAFHSVTVYSRGVLTNSLTGGLRSNLTYDSATALNYIDDLNSQAPDLTAITAPVFSSAAPTSAATEPIASPRPMITEIALDVVPFREDSPGGTASAPLRIGYRLRMEFWNPYPFPMHHLPAVGADDYRVRVSGLPTLTLSTPQVTQPSPNTYNLATLITPATDIIMSLDADLGAGEFIRRAQDPVFVGSDASAVTTVTISDATVPSVVPPASDDDRLDYSWPAGNLRFEIYKNDGSVNPIQIIENVPYLAGSRTNSTGSTPWYISGNNAFPGTSFTDTTHLVDKGISFHAAIDETRIANVAAWINPPDPTPAPYPADYRAATVSWNDGYFASAAGSPSDNASAAASMFPNVGEFQSGNRITLTDLSAQSQLSLGQLQFVGHNGSRPFAVGNPWGAGLNAIFDRSILLPVPNPGALTATDPWPVGRLLPNPRYKVWGSPTLGDLQSVNSAKNVLVDGAFNVNSTQEKAWEAVLGRATRFTTANDAGLSNSTVENPALFFPNATDLISTTQVAATVNRGHRGLTDVQIQDLATRIATAVRARANPFVSVQDFLNSGIVQQAITDNITAGGAAQVNSGATAYRSDYLTQAVLLDPLMPFLTVRSDTFVVRSYGEVLNPATGATEGVAYCEAIVQRVPEKVDGTNVMTDTMATNFGRKFQVVDFRWLTEDDL